MVTEKELIHQGRTAFYLASQVIKQQQINNKPIKGRGLVTKEQALKALVIWEAMLQEYKERVSDIDFIRAYKKSIDGTKP